MEDRGPAGFEVFPALATSVICLCPFFPHGEPERWSMIGSRLDGPDEMGQWRFGGKVRFRRMRRRGYGL
jgi:hypothetical protein